MLTLFFDHALLADGWARDVIVGVENGVIVSLAKAADRTGCIHGGAIALPGLPNLHSHAFQRGMAGLAERRGPGDDSFWTWRQMMYHFVERLTPEDLEAIATYAFIDMLEGGFTAVAEFHYLHHGRDGRPYSDPAELSARIAAAAATSGIGLTLLPVYYAQGGFGAQPASTMQRRFLTKPDSYLRLVTAAQDALRFLPDAAIGIAPHSLRAVTPDNLKTIVAAAPKGPIHIHIAEQIREVEDCLAWSGQRPVEWLLANQPVDARWCLVHATHMTNTETAALAHSDATAGLCPITEANLGDGVFAGAAFATTGGCYGVGSDSNVEITAPGELKQLEYSQRLALGGRNLMAQTEGESTGRRLYDEACRGGAQALGRGVGALAVGRRADIVTLNADHPDLACGSPDTWLDSYIFAAGKAAIDRVYVGGELLVEAGRHCQRAAVAARYHQALQRLTQS